MSLATRNVRRAVAVGVVALLPAVILTSPGPAAAAEALPTDASAYAISVPGSVLAGAAKEQTQLPAAQYAALLANGARYSAEWRDIETTYGTSSPTAPSSEDAAKIARLKASLVIPATPPAPVQAPPGTGAGGAAIPIFAGVIGAVLGANVDKRMGVFGDQDICPAAPNGAFDAVNQLIATATGTDCDTWQLSQEIRRDPNADVGRIANYEPGSEACSSAYSPQMEFCAKLSGQVIKEDLPEWMPAYYSYCLYTTSTVRPNRPYTNSLATSGWLYENPPTVASRSSIGGEWTTSPYPHCDTVPGATFYSGTRAGSTDPSVTRPTGWIALDTGIASTKSLVASGSPKMIDIDREFTCTLIYADGGISSQRSPAGTEGSGKLNAPLCPGSPPGKVPVRVKVYLTSPNAEGKAILVYDQATTDEFQIWREKFPDCADSSCPLDLRENGVSCLFQRVDCSGWLDNTDPGLNYSCWYGTHPLQLSECNIYGNTVDESARESGHAYSDPTTGSPVPGQTSTTRADELARRLVADGRTWQTWDTSTFSLGDAQTGSSRGATIREIARQCVAQGVSDDDCERLPIFSPGSDILPATLNDLQGLEKNPAWVQLNYADDNDRAPTGWYDETPPCVKGTYNSAGDAPKDCDEFPYRSTKQGGEGAQLAPIPREANRREGRYLGYFYSQGGCGVATPTAENPDRAFLVLPTTIAHTSIWCNRVKG